MQLSNVSDGGSTVFPKLGVAVTPERGSALVWFNKLKDGEPNPMTLHGGKIGLINTQYAQSTLVKQYVLIFSFIFVFSGCPVLHGNKWGKIWIWTQTLVPL